MVLEHFEIRGGRVQRRDTEGTEISAENVVKASGHVAVGGSRFLKLTDVVYLPQQRERIYGGTFPPVLFGTELKHREVQVRSVWRCIAGRSDIAQHIALA